MPRRQAVRRTVSFHRYDVLVVDVDTGESSIRHYDFYDKQPNDAAVLNSLNRRAKKVHAVKVKNYELVKKSYEMPIEEFIMSAHEVG